jgi:hypothetical protein
MSKAACVALLLLTAVAFGASATAADDAEQRAEARRQFDAGTKAIGAKRYREAALAFEAACAYRANGTALYTAGLAWEQAGEPDRAADAFTRALNTPGLGDKESKEARARLDELSTNLGAVSITGPSGVFVALDDHSDAPIPARLHGRAGRHVVVIRHPNDKVGHKNVQLKAGESIELDISPPAASASCPLVAPSSPSGPSTDRDSQDSVPSFPARKVLGIGFIGTGLAAAGAATILGLEALGSKDAYQAHPNRESFDHASSMQTMTNIAWASAAVMTVAGVTLVLWPARPKDTSFKGSVGVSPAPGGLTLRGAW